MSSAEAVSSILSDYNSTMLVCLLCIFLITILIPVVWFYQLVLCPFLWKPKKVLPAPPTPLCKRQISVHKVYPPTPYAIRFPQITPDIEPDSPSVIEFDPPHYFVQQSSKQEMKTSPLILNPSHLTSDSTTTSGKGHDDLVSTSYPQSGQGHDDLVPARDTVGVHVLRMPNSLEGDLLSTYGVPFPALTAADNIVEIKDCRNTSCVDFIEPSAPVLISCER